MNKPSITRRQTLSVMAGAFLWPMGAAGTRGLHIESRPLFGSTAEVMIRHASIGATSADPMRRVVKELERLNRDWNAWKPGVLVELNQALLQGRSGAVAPDLLALIRLARTLEARSGGLFNAGIGGLVSAWGFHADVLRPDAGLVPGEPVPWRGRAPSLSRLRVEAGGRLSSTDPRVQLDLGAIAKGWAIDRALDELARQGQPHAVVNLGGNLAVQGDAGGRPWQIGVRDPLGGGVVATVSTRSREAVVTSGSYERYRQIAGRRVSHIVDPRSGCPAEGLASVTVLHPSAAVADAAATALMVAGPRQWPFVAARMGVRQVLALHADGRGTMTSAMASRLRLRESRWTSQLKVIA
ncbi:MAG: FAD:protein FMN transferase [Hydrogenophaga sp.]|nr:FAD:protein FMN transferase [Hydrogenophaga sp.]